MSLSEIIPDGLEPIVARRAWSIVGDTLCSINHGATWTAGEALEARCPNPGEHCWEIVPRGMTLDEVIAHFSGPPQQVYTAPYDYRVQANSGGIVRSGFYNQQTTVSTWHAPIPPPSVHLERGMGYQLGQKKHLAPHEACSCGIYAAVDGLPLPKGDVMGEVYLWGKVIRGAQAHRAQFAYPSKFVVKAKYYTGAMAALLESFGCAIEFKPEKPPKPSTYQLMMQQQQLRQQQMMGSISVPYELLQPVDKKKKRWWR